MKNMFYSNKNVYVNRDEVRNFLYEKIDELNNDELYDIFSNIIDNMYEEITPIIINKD